MAEPQNIAKQAYLAYIKAKGFPPSKPTHLVKFSKTTSYPINYTKSKHIISNPPELPPPKPSENPYLDATVVKNFISINEDEIKTEIPTKSKIAAAYDIFLNKNDKPPTNTMEFHAFCEKNNLYLSYSECNEYMKHQNQTQKVNIKAMCNKFLNPSDCKPLPIVSNVHATPSKAYNYIILTWNAELSKENVWKLKSRLFFKIQCIKEDEKDEYTCTTDPIQFMKNKSVYRGDISKLTENCEYKITLKMMEEEEERTDFKPICITCILPKQLQEHLTGKVGKDGKDGTLIVKKGETKILDSDYNYEFTKVEIMKGGTLSVHGWHYDTKQGGRLIIKSLTSFSNYGKIDLNGKGYGGMLTASINDNGLNGVSIDLPSEVFHHQTDVAFGGVSSNKSMILGCGGAYGTYGKDLFGKDCGKLYGDKEINGLCLGMNGGEGSNREQGGNGGGAIKIECNSFINHTGEITANGYSAATNDAGCGSGGSIVVICNQDCYGTVGKIQAIGGRSQFNKKNVCNEKNVCGGGDGRIKFVTKRKNQQFSKYTLIDVQPEPFVEYVD
eukprot:279673_1